jgi:tRNA 2-thiouridine synthesizing protein C
MPLTWEDEDDDWAEKPSIHVVDRSEMARLIDAQDVVFNF